MAGHARTGDQLTVDDIANDYVSERARLDPVRSAINGVQEHEDRLTWPLAVVQTCVVHVVRSSLRYASKKHCGRITADLKPAYTAPTVEAAEARFAEFAERWRPTYPALVAVWERSWAEFTPFLDFPAEIRRLIYTTNGIESLNSRFRQASRRRGHFPSEQAATEVLYLTVLDRRPNRSNPTGRLPGWKSNLNTLAITYGDRLNTQRADPDTQEAGRPHG